MFAAGFSPCHICMANAADHRFFQVWFFPVIQQWNGSRCCSECWVLLVDMCFRDKKNRNTILLHRDNAHQLIHSAWQQCQTVRLHNNTWSYMYSSCTSTFCASSDGLKLDLTTTLTSIFCRPTSRTSGITRNGKLMSFVVRYLRPRQSNDLGF